VHTAAWSRTWQAIIAWYARETLTGCSDKEMAIHEIVIVMIIVITRFQSED
jgi:hypothetical protein